MPEDLLAIVVRDRTDALGKLETVRNVVSGIDPNIPLFWTGTVSAMMKGWTRSAELFGRIYAFFGLTALFLALVGIFSVTSFSVNQRKREIGIRMALGAPREVIVRAVMGAASLQVFAGLVLGLGLALVAGPALQEVLAGTSPRDVTVLAASAAVIALTAAVAVVFPALRASRIDPAHAIYHQ